MKAVFDEHCSAWTPNFESNVLYVHYQQNYMNDLLKARGYVTILDVFRYLGFMIDFDHFNSKKLGEISWVYGEGAYIDFGMEPDKEKNVIYLNFNIDID